jgi:membrane-associated phospholipid phosphatase
VALKVAVRTRSPNGDPLGWPSGHTSSSFTFATVIWEEYGPCAGVPAMLFAGYVGYERIDARNHDFSDVISGALIGLAIGHAVTQNHMPRILGFDIAPYVDPASGAVGVAASKRW